MSKPLMVTRDLVKEYVTGDVVTRVLRGISLEIEAGEFVAIMGPSGSGKSTLMHILGFLDRQTDGSYKYKDKTTADYTDDQLAHIRNQEVGFVFQSFYLLPKTSVFENVKLPLWYSDKKINDDDVREAIDAVGLSHRSKNLSNQLSGGEKQRVAIARALVNRPDIIFADEPTGNLDSKSGQQVMDIIQKLNDKGKTVILVTHEQYTAEHAKRIIRLRDGSVESDKEVTSRKYARDGELLK